MSGIMCVLLGGSGQSDIITLNPATYSAFTTPPDDASLDIYFTSTGQVQTSENGLGTTFRYYWIDNISHAGLYEVRCTPTAGSFSTGIPNTWLPLTLTRSFSVIETGTGSKTCTFTAEIRLASSGAVKDSASITIEAFAEF